MYKTHHYLHIPIMGTGFTIDTALRVAKFGISSVLSLVDDLLIERIRKHYAAQYGLPFEPVSAGQPDARARRITAYLNMIDVIVTRQIEEIRALPFEAGNDKIKYFELLPDTSSVKKLYLTYLGTLEGPEKRQLELDLTQAIVPGKIDCNIMTKLDRITYDREGHAMSMEHADAKSALRGFANSTLRADIVFSAGINPTLYGYMESFPDFYRTEDGPARKGVILKVSDYRSSMIQGKFIAKKGIEVREFRIESGLNCGGHAFASDGYLMGPILQEFKDNRARFPEIFEPMIASWYEKKGRTYPAEARNRDIPVTAQGGIGNHAEVQRLMDYYGIDATGWASPFLLVPEATALDGATRQQLAAAKEEDLYLSDVSPLGVVFNNLRNSTSEQWTKKQITDGKPGSPCPKKFLVSNTEFTDKPICTASKEYQGMKLKAMGVEKAPPPDTPDQNIQAVYQKSCICDQLGNGALINLGIIKAENPVSVCPGPNIAYFDRLYTLREMVNHIYGRGRSLVPNDRPHMFSKDLVMSVDYYGKLVDKLAAGDPKGFAYLAVFRANLLDGLEYYRALVESRPYPGENLASLKDTLVKQGSRLADLWKNANEKMGHAPALQTAASP
ncbi:MAG TPA: hypothetical protein VJ385_02410 [Fibrobacteria bacterium]|nr:hypothetical protein [Fibrobacteria bacterium]